MELFTLSDVHYEIMREIGNIGCGHAVSALSKMLNKKVGMKVPQVKLLEFGNVAGFVGGPENTIISIFIGISGEINGMILFLTEQPSARVLVNMVFGTPKNTELSFSEMELSAIQEIGNIMCSSYLSSFASLISKSISQSVPDMSIDMAGAILSVPAIEFGKIAEHVLFIESVFSTETDNVSGYFVLVPDLPSFKKIMSALGVD
ncbi:MAG: chemotaxis protein CheC [Clostridiales bacterium]|jgi:chemotaxis protein CheC|nr:chemotaxis protein CheC [Clostridiales bacterium]